MPFEKEIATYDANLIDLLGSQGKYVLILGDEISGPFETSMRRWTSVTTNTAWNPSW
jgi:hypothetical protein